jgi:hypothetical protein
MSSRMPQLYDIKNEQRESSTAHVGTVSQTVRSGNGPYKEKYHALPALTSPVGRCTMPA